VLCGSGPRLPVGEEITIFSVDKPSTAMSSACLEVFAVAKGNAEWDPQTGKPIAQEQLKAKARVEEHPIDFHFDYTYISLPSGWNKLRPGGPACLDTSGSPNDVRRRSSSQNCSIAIEYPDTPSGPQMLFANLIVTGPVTTEAWDQNPRVMPELVFANLRSHYGDKYAITQSYRSGIRIPPSGRLQNGSAAKLDCEPTIKARSKGIQMGSSGGSIIELVNGQEWQSDTLPELPDTLPRLQEPVGPNNIERIGAGAMVTMFRDGSTCKIRIEGLEGSYPVG
jgi:hypothetical protein